MRDSVGSHEQLKPEKSGQELLTNVGAPHSLLPCKRLVDQVNHGVEERAGARRRVEDEHAGVSQPLWAAEAGLEEMVNGTNDEGDNSPRSVVNPSDLAHPGIVGSKERLVEVDHRVLLGFSCAEVF